MARTLALTVHRVSDVHRRKCFLGRNPKIYVEIKIKNTTFKQPFKTSSKVIRDSNTECDEPLTVSSIEESQTMQISLKATTFLGERVIGEIECKASDLPSRETTSPENHLKVYRPRDKMRTRATGTITVTAKYSDSEPGPQVPSLNENKVQNAHDVDLPLLPSEVPLAPLVETQASPSGPLEPLANVAETPALTEELAVAKEEGAVIQELPEENAQRLFAGAQVSVANELSPDSLYGKVGKVLDKLELLRGIVGKIEELAKLHPWSDLAWQVCTSLFKVVKNQHSTDTKIIDLVTKIEATLDFVDDADKIKADAIPLRPIIEELLKQVAKCATFICTYLQPSFAERAVKGLLIDPAAKITEFDGVFVKLQDCLKTKVLLHTGFVSSKILGVVEELRDYSIIDVLKPAHMNAANRPLCLHGTREGVLQTIMDWVENVNDNEKSILWLHGLAGSGKSTIANTVAVRLHELRRLGAFLFFARDKTDRDAIIHTIAKQLADADPALRSEICAAIERDRRTVSSHLEKQFVDLLRRPLTTAAQSLLGPIVIVLDALDEYGDINARKSLLTLIADEFTHLPNNFRFLITSRPELDIKSLFSWNPKITSISLNEIEDTIPEIRLYLASKLAHIRKAKGLSGDWPEEYKLNRVVNMSEGLFIWASTLSKFLSGTNDPARILGSILWSGNKDHAKGLDQLYVTVLNARNDWHSGLGEQFRAVARVVLLSKTPLSDIDIDQLLERPDGKSCRSIFEDFHCLFDHSPAWPIRPLHASFGDYLTDITRSGGQPWSLAECDVDHDLVLRCFRVMSTQLRFNICNFETSDRLNCDYPNLEERIEKHISPQLRYASTCWWRHLKEIQTWHVDVGSALRSFSKGKLLFWLEVVSLVGNVQVTLKACDIAYKFAVDQNSELATLWTNLRMFIEEYTEAISGSALHVYISAHCSPFMQIHNWNPQPGAIAELTHNHDIFPRVLSHTILCKHYLACSPDSLLLLSDCSSGSLWVQWKPLSDKGTDQLSTQLEKPYPEDPHCRPDCIAMSSDCRRAAGYFYNKGGISIWDVETGRVEIHCMAPEDYIFALAFHPLDSGQLAIGSSNAISVWNIVAEGTMCSIKIDHTAYQITWSPDGAYLASHGSESSAVWSVNRTTATITLQRDFSDLKSYDLCFSPKTQSHILFACKRELFLYDFQSNERVFGPYTTNNLSPITDFRHCTFSPDGSLIAASSKYTIQIFEAESGQPYQDLIVTPDDVDQVIFLPDGKQIAALVGDTVYTWELCHGSQVSDQERFDRANTQGHFGWITLTSFSPDGTKFLSSSWDGTVHVRSSNDCMLLREYWPMEYPQRVTAAVFSADNKTIYLALKDGTVRTSSGKVLYRPKERQSIENLHVYVSQLTFEEHIVFSPFKSRKAFVIPGNGSPEQDLHKISLEGGWDRSAVSSNGLIASFAFNSRTVKFVDLEGDHQPHPLLITKYTDLDALFFSQNGELVSLGSDTGKSQDQICSDYGINVWDIKSGTCLQTFSLPELNVPWCVTLNANLLALTNRKSMIIYDIEKGALVHTFKSWNSFFHLDIHGSKLISSSYGQIIMWDLSALDTDETTPHSDAAGTPPSIHSSSVSPQWSIEHVNYRLTGWVLGSNGEQLLWVPEKLRYYLDPPGSTHVIRHRRLKLPDFIPDMDSLKNYEGVGRLNMK